jgi:hypothetical protein
VRMGTVRMGTVRRVAVRRHVGGGRVIKSICRFMG